MSVCAIFDDDLIYEVSYFAFCGFFARVEDVRHDSVHSMKRINTISCRIIVVHEHVLASCHVTIHSVFRIRATFMGGADLNVEFRHYNINTGRLFDFCKRCCRLSHL
jgi:hypothetical protein